MSNPSRKRPQIPSLVLPFQRPPRAGVTRCHPWLPGLRKVPGAPDPGQLFPWEKLFQPNRPGHGCSPCLAVTFQAVALGTKCPGASRGPSQQIQTGNTGSGSGGVIPCGAGYHPRSPPSSRAEGFRESSGIGARKFGNSGLLRALPGSHPGNPGWESSGLPVTSERPFPRPHPCPSDLPLFPRSNSTHFKDHPFSILSSCNPCNSPGSVPSSSSPRFPYFPVFPHILPESGPSSHPTESHIPGFFPFLGMSQPFISRILGCRTLETLPGKSAVNGIFNDGGGSPAVSEFSWVFYGIAVNSGNNGSRVR
ncbi:uncharacterized protein LOC131573857 [Poecile atricapillus]|uniref:uncharacterized protein LOC131573857 n=1 Tax=Poecile atricapillus TaxID=48891 RepID=UPI002738E821|nr:uncharacterized protein LOC131573857 [Poecile atricapillus]XP_058684163.1 uncharacterized protein LOC131573857 [Poecile atricapillus]XP_058684164.1 uncharacterized protein LOC131573857 [Poecile atricapillus]XP_058684165.1 uncharacterized protein LOC131573857 [Poecile atricapillus]XP_058684166.1 uncharacterized protein LOC131573857 [Poecile atricapillus]XP_058684167.1 uncharacterized protein LOC131573857 [Poecile atricapillus]